MSKYHQTLTNPSISVTGFPELADKAIVNEVVTGKVPVEKLDYTDNFLVSNPCKLFSLALGAELDTTSNSRSMVNQSTWVYMLTTLLSMRIRILQILLVKLLL
jgi:hypothetical protein